jgi:hypothetical protein
MTAMRSTTRAGLLGLFTLATATGCGAAGGDDGAGGGGTGGGAPSARSLASTPAAEARVASLRERFQVRPVAQAPMPQLPGMPSEPAPGPQVVIGEDVARGFVATATGLRPLVPPEVKRRGMKSATVELPLRATDPVTLDDDTTGMRVRFSLMGARDVAAEAAGGIAVYPGAIGGADLVHRVHAEGTEDFVVFETRPAREERGCPAEC